MSMENKEYDKDKEIQTNHGMSLDDEARIRVLSPSQLVLKRFVRNRLAITGTIFLLVMFLFSYVGGWLIKYEEDQVFTKYEEMYKVYAGITVNEELKYVVAQGESFSNVSISQFVLAASNEESLFESGDQVYMNEKIDDDYYLIYGTTEIGLSTALGKNITINTMDESLGEAFESAAIEAIGKEALMFEVGPKTYIISYGKKNNVIFEAREMAVATKNIYDFAAQDVVQSFAFAKAVENTLRTGWESFAVEGIEYTIMDNEGIMEIIKDGEVYANISRYQIQPFLEDVFFDLKFKEAIRKAVDSGVESFTFQEEEGVDASFRLYRQNLQWTLEHAEPTYLIDEYSSPNSKHWMGTDGHGMDILTRLMYGGRISLRIGFIVVIIETFIGIVLGGVAGYFGKFWDNLIMRIVDIFNCIPFFPLIIILGSVMDQLRIDPQTRLNMLMLVLAIFGWPGIARMVRGQTLTLREQEFMTATEATGIRVSKRIFKHLIPNIVPQLIVICTLSLGSVILAESTLSFLGVGVKFPFASWGNIINAVSNVHVMSNYLFVWIPAGLCILITVLGFNFIGDGLRDAFDPKMKR